MPLIRRPLSKPYEPKSFGLTYLRYAIRGQSKGKVPSYISIPYKQAKEIVDLWKQDKEQLAKLRASITQSEERQ